VTDAARETTDTRPRLVDLASQPVVAVRGAVPPEQLPAFFAGAFEAAARAAEGDGVPVTGPPFARYPEPPGDVVVVEAGFPVAAPVRPHADAYPTELRAGRAVEAVHVGAYDELERTYSTLTSWIEDQGLHAAADMWEWYLVGPETATDPSTWRTKVVVPLQ
jgi:effector-binding domain-containing protein